MSERTHTRFRLLLGIIAAALLTVPLAWYGRRYAGQFLEGYRQGQQENLVFKNGYTWRPFGSAYYVGDPIVFREHAVLLTQAAGDRATFRLRVLEPDGNTWKPIGEFTPEMPRFTFTEKGIYALGLDSKTKNGIKHTWMGQFFASPSAYRENRTNMLRTIVSHHTQLLELGNETRFYRAVTQELLLALLMLFQQHNELEKEEFLALIRDFKVAEIEPAEPSPRDRKNRDSAVLVNAEELGPVRINLAQGRLWWGRYADSYTLLLFPEVKTSFEKTRNEPPRVAVAAALTYVLHCHFIYSVLPNEKIVQGYPSLTRLFGHCGTYQNSLFHLLKAMGYTTRKIGTVYNKGAIHGFNEIRCGKHTYTLDATASVLFRGSIAEREESWELVRLPTTSILTDVFWTPSSSTSILPARIESVHLGDYVNDGR